MIKQEWSTATIPLSVCLYLQITLTFHNFMELLQQYELLKDKASCHIHTPKDSFTRTISAVNISQSKFSSFGDPKQKS